MNFEKSQDTKILEGVLAEAAIGQMITYEELSKAIGRDVREHSLSSLVSARRGLMKEKRYVFGVERNVGLRRLADEQIVDSTEADRRKVQRAARRSIQKLSVVDFDQLPEEKKRDHLTYSTTMGVVAMFSNKASHRRIEKTVNGSHKPLAIGETLKLFS